MYHKLTKNKIHFFFPVQQKKCNAFHILAREPVTVREGGEGGEEEEGAVRLKLEKERLECMKHLYSHSLGNKDLLLTKDVVCLPYSTVYIP